MGQGVSIVGSQFSSLAIQMIAVTALQANPAQMGFLTASQTLPYLLLSLFIGVLVDRYSKRALLLWADGMRAAILVSAAALLVLGHMTVWELCAIVSSISLFTLIFDAALGAVIPELFEPGLRISVNSRLNMTLAGGDVFGPSLSGYALRMAGVTGTMLADAFTYLISAVCIFRGIPQGRKTSEENMAHIPRIGIFRSVAEGVSFVATHRVLRILGIGSAIWNFSWSAVLAVLVIHCIRDLRLTTIQIGIAFAAGGVGGIVGSLLGWHLGRIFQRGPVLVFTPLIGIAGSLLLLTSLQGYVFLITALALFLYNLGESSFGVNMQTTRQTVTPLPLMGRMDTAMRFCFKGMASLGAIAGGVVATRFCLQTTVLLGVTGLIATFVVFIASSLRKFSDATT
jgi:predicted MFS family arabinose efflux permease